MTSSNKKIIEIKNVSFSYSTKKKTLDGISLDIFEKQIVALLGPNGGGKTTLFKIVSSLIRSYDGEVVIDGMDQKQNLSRVLSKLGVVFQSPSLDKKLTVEENLIYQGNLYGYSKKQILFRMDLLLETLSVQDRKYDLVDELSGGLARRVEIVKSLLHSPKILILDEPSSGLDIGVRIDLWNLLKKIQQEQSVTILLTTHFIEEADRCDHIALLNHGKILASGAPSELKQKLTFKWFQIKPKNIPVMKKFIKDRFDVSATEENEFLQFRVDPENARNVSNELAAEVEELTYRDPSLEDVFVYFAGRKIRESETLQ